MNENRVYLAWTTKPESKTEDQRIYFWRVCQDETLADRAALALSRIEDGDKDCKAAVFITTPCGDMMGYNAPLSALAKGKEMSLDDERQTTFKRAGMPQFFLLFNKENSICIVQATESVADTADKVFSQCLGEEDQLVVALTVFPNGRTSIHEDWVSAIGDPAVVD